MRKRTVVWSDQAGDDLSQLEQYISDASSLANAMRFIERLVAFGERLEYAAERGTRRDDIRPRLRIVGFERRVTLAFVVEPERVVILRAFYGGVNWDDILQ